MKYIYGDTSDSTNHHFIESRQAMTFLTTTGPLTVGSVTIGPELQDRDPGLDPQARALDQVRAAPAHGNRSKP